MAADGPVLTGEGFHMIYTSLKEDPVPKEEIGLIAEVRPYII